MLLLRTQKSRVRSTRADHYVHIFWAKKRNAAMYEKCLLYQLCISLKKNRQLLEKLEQNGARECSLPVSQFIKTLVQPRVP